MRLAVIGMCALGCASAEEDKDARGIMIEGAIELSDRDSSAVVRGVRAFGYDDDGRMLTFISNNANATCAGVAEVLGPNGSATDPSDVYEAGTCHMLISVSDFDGGWEHTWSEGSDEFSKAVSSAVMCAMDDGDFELVDTVNGEGYQWTGTWWVGTPAAYSWSFSGGGGDDIELDMRMTRYNGALPLTAEYTEVDAEGIVEGVVTAEWCPELASAVVF